MLGVVRGGVGYCAAWGCAAIYSCLVVALLISLSFTGSVQHFQSLAVESDRGGWCCCWIGWGSGALGGRGCISLYIQLKSRIYT